MKEINVDNYGFVNMNMPLDIEATFSVYAINRLTRTLHPRTFLHFYSKMKNYFLYNLCS